MYIFKLKNGKNKLAYGNSPEDALNILRIRLTDEEMSEICQDQYVRIPPRKLQEYIHDLG